MTLLTTNLDLSVPIRSVEATEQTQRVDFGAKIEEILVRGSPFQFSSSWQIREQKREIARLAFKNLFEEESQILTTLRTIQSWRSSGQPILFKAYKRVLPHLIATPIQRIEQNEVFKSTLSELRVEYEEFLRNDKELNQIQETLNLILAHHEHSLGRLIETLKSRSCSDVSLLVAVLDKRNIFDLIKAKFSRFQTASQMKPSKWRKEGLAIIQSVMNLLVAYKERASPDSERVGPRKKLKKDQAIFVDTQKEAIQNLSKQIPFFVPWETVFREALLWRSRCAMIQLDKDWESFGIQFRKTGLISRVRLCNAEYLTDKIARYIHQQPTSSTKQCILERAVNGRFFQSDGSCVEIPLTRMAHIIRPISIKGREENSGYLWIHPETTHQIHLALNPARVAYEAAVQAETFESLMESVARLHWWFCQACPCARGSAAIMEVIAESILEAKGANLTIKEGVLIDIEALSEPNEENFVKAYLNFWESKKKSDLGNSEG